ncbi:MAG: HesA/MoeB/ThiF family protein [Bacteroidota bacterium]
MDTTRYQRQIQLAHFGIEAQEKLSNAKVLVIGAGGLGCPVLIQLAIAGVGCIGIIDKDVIEYHNLHRQFLYDESDVGKLKTEVARAKLKQANSEIDIHVYNLYLHNKNTIDILQSYDLIIDCCDNFETRYMLNDACILLDKPFIYGSISAYQGQVSICNVAIQNTRSVSYRDFFPQMPKADEIPSCNELGTLGVLCSIIGNYQAAEAIKYITQIGDLLTNKLLSYDLLTHQQTIYTLAKKNAVTSIPLNIDAFESYEYQLVSINTSTNIEEMTELKKLVENKNAIIVDVRQFHENPQIEAKQYIQIPLSELEMESERLENIETLIFVCQGGVRSMQAQLWASEKFPTKKTYYFSKGIENIKF